MQLPAADPTRLAGPYRTRTSARRPARRRCSRRSTRSSRAGGEVPRPAARAGEAVRPRPDRPLVRRRLPLRGREVRGVRRLASGRRERRRGRRRPAAGRRLDYGRCRVRRPRRPLHGQRLHGQTREHGRQGRREVPPDATASPENGQAGAVPDGLLGRPDRPADRLLRQSRGNREVLLQSLDALRPSPQICVLYGPCIAGAAYTPVFADFTVMVRDVSAMAIASREWSRWSLAKRSPSKSWAVRTYTRSTPGARILSQRTRSTPESWSHSSSAIYRTTATRSRREPTVARQPTPRRRSTRSSRKSPTRATTCSTSSTGSSTPDRRSSCAPSMARRSSPLSPESTAVRSVSWPTSRPTALVRSSRMPRRRQPSSSGPVTPTTSRCSTSVTHPDSWPVRRWKKGASSSRVRR